MAITIKPTAPIIKVIAPPRASTRPFPNTSTNKQISIMNGRIDFKLPPFH